MSQSAVRREVYFHGRVQGVGFRQTTYELARQFRVVGFVQNLPDGRVLLTIEGEPDELDRFVAGTIAAMGRRVAGYDTDEFPARGNFHDFTIQY
jgi:acylphosphatase